MIKKIVGVIEGNESSVVYCKVGVNRNIRGGNIKIRGRCTKPRNISKVIILENWN